MYCSDKSGATRTDRRGGVKPHCSKNLFSANSHHLVTFYHFNTYVLSLKTSKTSFFHPLAKSEKSLKDEEQCSSFRMYQRLIKEPPTNTNTETH